MSSYRPCLSHQGRSKKKSGNGWPGATGRAFLDGDLNRSFALVKLTIKCLFFSSLPSTLCIHDSTFLYFYWNSSFYATFEYLCMNNDLYCQIHCRALNTLFSSSVYLRARRYLSLVQDWNNGICCTLLNTLNCLFPICHPRLAGLMFSFFATSHSKTGTPQDAQVVAGHLGGFPLSQPPMLATKSDIVLQILWHADYDGGSLCLEQNAHLILKVIFLFTSPGRLNEVAESSNEVIYRWWRNKAPGTPGFLCPFSFFLTSPGSWFPLFSVELTQSFGVTAWMFVPPTNSQVESWRPVWWY